MLDSHYAARLARIGCDILQRRLIVHEERYVTFYTKTHSEGKRHVTLYSKICRKMARMSHFTAGLTVHEKDISHSIPRYAILCSKTHSKKKDITLYSKDI